MTYDAYDKYKLLKENDPEELQKIINMANNFDRIIRDVMELKDKVQKLEEQVNREDKK